MTRFKLIPWLAIPVLLLLGPVLPTATAATPASVELEDGLIYLPLDEVPTWLTTQGAKTTRLGTSAALGEVTVAQYGVSDALVANRNGFLCVRFDFPFSPPYTVTKLSFRSRTQCADPARFASFRSVRVMGMNATTGLPDKSQTLYHKRRYLGSSTGGVNDIPLNLAITDAGKVLFAVFEFPAPTAGICDTFPFFFTDRQYTDAGLFANSYATDSNAVVRKVPAPFVGTFTGTALLADQNLQASMTCQLSGTAPLNAPSGLGLNVRDSLAEFSYTAPSNVLADGTPVAGNHLQAVELVERNITWSTVASGGAGAGRVVLPSVPSGLHIWGVRSLDFNGLHSVVSNVTISGAAIIVGTGAVGEDADEPNGRASEDEATALTVPVTDRAETIWPAGDQDNYWFLARAGDVITTRVTPTRIDFRNDLFAVVQILNHSRDVVATGTSPDFGAEAQVVYNVPPKKGEALRRFFVRVVDWNGSMLDPTSGPRVLVPPTYNLSVDVSTPASLAQFGPSGAPVSSLLDPDAFDFANTGRNPVRAGYATFGYMIPRSAAGGVPVRIRIYDVHGRVMSTLVNGTRTAGTHHATWSGHDARGNRVASGPYFARMEAGTWSRTVRIDLVK